MKATDNALERLIYQYQNSQVFKNYIFSLLKDYDDFYEILENFLTRLDIDQSVGIQLDLIGEIVGQKRPDSTASPFFEFPESETFAFAGGTGLGFGGTSDPEIGGYFAGVSPELKLGDAGYRILLRGAIFKNSASNSVENLFLFSRFVFGVNVFIQNYVTFVNLTFGKILNENEREILHTIFPLAAGIRIGQIQFALGDNPFSLDGDENGSGLSSTTETIGSGFVGIFST